MGKLVYSTIASLDGYVADEAGDFSWAVPDEEVHTFINDAMRPYGTYLYGRRMYEMMAGWETEPPGPEQPSALRDFAEIWQAADKVVYSTTLERPGTARTRIERTFDPDAVRRLKADLGHDLAIGGPGLAAHALAAGLVDECQLYLAPSVVGGGKRVFPAGLRIGLDLLDERRFGNGMAYLRYRARA
ncbi:dihydrofolate reductase family protein [Streptomyces sp. NPDC059063]|uniref:dihydrofolate reductase family protein n=1 Tax=unclassified Streptomyces TaxID=2593676 RepID=UPI003686D55C